jgi:hypothetical protein
MDLLAEALAKGAEDRRRREAELRAIVRRSLLQGGVDPFTRAAARVIDAERG